jgi:glycosyltransferase involved in cell wall biosynthesis
MNTYNENRNYLQQAIESCLNQKEVLVQLIVSTVEGDDNMDFIKKFPVDLCVMDRKDHAGRSPKGSYQQLNNALKLITGDWFFFISSNDILFPFKSIQEIDYCRLKKAKICYSNFYHVDQSCNVIRETEYFDYSHEKHLRGNYMSDATMVQVDILRKYTPFNTDLNNCAFWDMWLRIFEGEGNIFCFNPNPAFMYRVMSSSMHIERQKSRDERNKENNDRRNMLQKHA